MNMIDITPIVNAVIALLAAGVSVFLIPWIKSKDHRRAAQGAARVGQDRRRRSRAAL